MPVGPPGAATVLGDMGVSFPVAGLMLYSEMSFAVQSGPSALLPSGASAMMPPGPRPVRPGRGGVSASLGRAPGPRGAARWPAVLQASQSRQTPFAWGMPYRKAGLPAVSASCLWILGTARPGNSIADGPGETLANNV